MSTELDVIYSKINIVKNCLSAIERVKSDEKDNIFRQNLYELNLQRAIQACIDLAFCIVAKEGLGLPNTYKMAFELLRKNSIIDEILAKKMVSMVGFRNISVHEYDEVNPQVVISIVDNHLIDFENYIKAVYNYTTLNWQKN